MSIFFWSILLLAAHGAVFSKEGYHRNYIAQESIQPIKGIFLLLVFLSHFVQYVELSGVWDAPYFEVRRYLGQLVVVPFLFYSGYGIAESIQKKGLPYVKSMPKHRILKVLLQFDAAVLLFLAVRYIMGFSYDLRRIFLTLLGWEGVGNSNWYIFAILFLYSASFVSFLIFQKGKLLPLLCMTVLTGIFVLVLRQYKEDYWYNTVFAYTAGMWFSCYRKPFEGAVLEKPWNYRVTLALTFLLFLFLHSHWSSLVVYEAASVAFALLIVLISAKVQLRSRFLSYCGEHLFSLFILQRIPMIVLNNTPIEQHPDLYLTACLAITFLLSAAFDKIMRKLLR